MFLLLPEKEVIYDLFEIHVFFCMLEIVDGIIGGLMRPVEDLLIEGEKENHRHPNTFKHARIGITKQKLCR